MFENEDKFWSINSKLTIEEIEKRFPKIIADALKEEKALKEVL